MLKNRQTSRFLPSRSGPIGRRRLNPREERHRLGTSEATEPKSGTRSPPAWCRTSQLIESGAQSMDDIGNAERYIQQTAPHVIGI